MAYGIGSLINFDGTKSIPTDGNSNAKPADFATKFVVAFDVAPQIINAADKTVVIYKNGVFIKTIVIPSASVQVVGKTLEITHGITSFTAGDVYSVAITDGAIDNLAPGALANGVYDFRIGDYVAPTLLSTATAYSPNKGAVNVVANLTGGAFSLTIPFDEPVTIPATPGNKAVYIYKEDGTIVDIVKVASLTVANGLQTATVTIPVAANAIFQENTNYYVVIDEGAFIDFNSYNNKNAFGGLSAKTTWTFSTRDNSAPVISAKSISAVSTTSATLNVTLAEAGKYYYLVALASAADPSVAAVAAGTAVSVAASAVGTNLTASLTGLTGATEYKVWLVTENSVGVKSATPTSLSFKTVDNTAPSIIARGTLMNTAKATNALYMVFNEQIMGAGSGTLDLRKNSDESYVKQIAATAITSRKITADEVTANTFGSGRSINEWVTLVDLGALASNVNYYIVFPAGYIKDLAGNSFAGAGAYIVPINKTDWTFTSSDFEMPTVTAAFATPASLSSAITLTFNEQVQKQLSTTTDWTQVIALEQNNTPVLFTASPASAASATVITLTPGASLSANTTYTVRLRNNAVMDVSSNMNKITTEKVFTLTTGDLDMLTVAYGSSEDATSNVTPLLANSSLKIKFNKAIKVNTTGSTWVAADATNLKPLITFKKAAVDQAFTLTYDATTFTATLTPTTALVSGATDYYFTFNGIKVDDVALVAPVALTASGTLTYTVSDFLAPVVTLSKAAMFQVLLIQQLLLTKMSVY